MTYQKLNLKVAEQKKTHPTLSEIKVYLQIGKQHIQKQIDHYFHYQSRSLQQLQNSINTMIGQCELMELNLPNESQGKAQKAKENRMYLERIKYRLNFVVTNKVQIYQKVCSQVEQIIINSFKIPGLKNQVMRVRRQNLKNTAMEFLKEHDKFCRKNFDENKTIIRLDQFAEKHYQQFKGFSSIPQPELQSAFQHFCMEEIINGIGKNRIKLEQKIKQDYKPFIEQLNRLMVGEVRPSINHQQQSYLHESQMQQNFYLYSSNGLNTEIQSEDVNQYTEEFKKYQMNSE